MSANWYEDVLEFHWAIFPHLVGTTPQIPDGESMRLRMTLLFEEWIELITALQKDDLPGIADGIADLIYVALGVAVTYGIDLNPVWDAVQTANMAKVGGERRPDGKVLKPPDWVAPDIERILSLQRDINEVYPVEG